ncbi:hypothetical protein F511_11867 [Dorcoceras hygrometricum]|uniref:Uncharacterized protein n=1 Tax=Dorcoceras hygrometricum TaxID=472368 RepID=A0A2Z7A4J6_9LAMI|nr:hypothetical protein F511_11867 [Dorcoceras hygrometricum]
MSLFDLQDVCIAIGSIATLDLPMIVDLIGIYGLKGPYCTLTTTNWFLQVLSVIPRGSWGDVARCSYHDPLDFNIQQLNLTLNLETWPPPLLSIYVAAAAHVRRRLVTAGLNSFRVWFGPVPGRPEVFRADFNIQQLNLTLNLETWPPPLLSIYAAAAARLRRKIISGQFDEENPSTQISSRLLVQGDEGVFYPVMDRIGDIYRNLPRRADVIVTTVGARHKCQQAWDKHVNVVAVG